MIIRRVEQTQINKSHPIYKAIDDLCFKSKNLYNYANYIIRQTFIICSNLYNNKKINEEQQQFLIDINKKVDEYNQHKLEVLKKKQSKGKDLSKKYKPIKYFSRDNKRCSYDFIDFVTKYSNAFTDLGSNSAQQCLRLLDEDWESFFEGIKKYSKCKDGYLGKPNIPNYKKKDGRQVFSLCNNQFKIKNGYIYFCWKPFKIFNNKIKTKVTDKPIQLRFIPRNNIYVMELVYEKEIPDIQEVDSKCICGIDIGINNFATLTNNIGVKPIIINGKIIKSINQFYNKKLSHYKSILKKTNKMDYSNRLNRITLKRNNMIKNYMHKASKNVIEYCKGNNIDTIIIGNNPEWKQKSSLHKTTNQHFVQIPYENFINMIMYKGLDAGIKVVITEEKYTSGTSFLDRELPRKSNYNKDRRIKRGLFQSNSHKLINSDVNGSLQIIKKVIPNAFNSYGIEGLDLTPLVINL